MDGSKGKSTLASKTANLSNTDGETFQDTTLYRSTIGTLQYLTCTRPKIVFIINKINHSTAYHHSLGLGKKVLIYIKETLSHSINLKLASSLTLAANMDADRTRNMDNRRSTGG